MGKARNLLIIGENAEYNMDCYQTKTNNNVVIVGASGAGKTRGIVIPNLLETESSILISDPKGNLYHKYGSSFQKRGYVVKTLDFIHPATSSKYNFFTYIRNYQDVIKIATMIMRPEERYGNMDPFWDEAGTILLIAIIGYVKFYLPPYQQNFAGLMDMLDKCEASEDDETRMSEFDTRMEALEKKDPGNFVCKQYRKFKMAAGKTLKSILISVAAKIGKFDLPDIRVMTKMDEMNISDIGREKTIVFVEVSDTDRSMDFMANLFFSQAMNELCRVADEECEGYRLPVDVRFMLDDFATNVSIAEFPRMSASIRSRGISFMIMIQSEGQLKAVYGADDKTILSNCDTYVYLGGNDVETAGNVARRCNLPTHKILNMQIGSCWVFRRGQKNFCTNVIDLDKYIKQYHSELLEGEDRTLR